MEILIHEIQERKFTNEAHSRAVITFALSGRPALALCVIRVTLSHAALYVTKVGLDAIGSVKGWITNGQPYRWREIADDQRIFFF